MKDKPTNKNRIIPVRRKLFKDWLSSRFVLFVLAGLLINVVLIAASGGFMPDRLKVPGFQSDLYMVKLKDNRMPNPAPPPQEREALRKSLYDSFNSDDKEAVIAKTTEYLEKYPGDPQRDKVLMWRADAYIALDRDYDKAEADAKEVIKMGKQGATPYLFLASHIYNDNNKNWEGYEAIKKAYELNPNIEKDPYFQGKKARLASFYTIAGELAHDCGDYRGSIEFIKKAVKLGSLEHNSLFARNEIAVAYFKIGDMENAARYSTEWLAKDAPVLKAKYLDYNYYINMSNANMIIGKPKEALKYLEECRKVVSADHHMGVYYFEKGRIYFTAGDYKKAKENFDYIRKAFPDWEDEVDTFELARMERLMAQKKAMRNLGDLPEDAAASLRSEAQRLMNEHKFTEAAMRLTIYLENYATEADRDEILLKRADAYIGYIEQRTDMPGFMNLKEYKLAEADLKEAARRGKSGATPYLMMATQLYCGNDLDEKAYKALKEAYKIRSDVENDPFFITYEKGKPVRSPQKQAEFLTLSGSICEKVGQYGEAIERYNKAVAMNNKHNYPIYSSTEILREDALLYRARAYFKTGNYEKAREDASEWLKKYKPAEVEHPEECENLAWANLMTGNYDEALRLANMLIEKDPEYYGTYTFIGCVYLTKGDYKEARRNLEIVRKNFKSPKYRYDLTELQRLERLLRKKAGG